MYLLAERKETCDVRECELRLMSELSCLTPDIDDICRSEVER